MSSSCLPEVAADFVGPEVGGGIADVADAADVADTAVADAADVADTAVADAATGGGIGTFVVFVTFFGSPVVSVSKIIILILFGIMHIHKMSESISFFIFQTRKK